ncbi:MAG: hypothetical protein N2Z21_10140 [Candidatus Sumerlaeaceae bacterium]|nr:hypothetical protein [Candidatus Sumerlaeaceae bacterium]
MAKDFNSKPGEKGGGASFSPIREVCHYLTEYGYKHTLLDDETVKFVSGQFFYHLRIEKLPEDELLYVSLTLPRFYELAKSDPKSRIILLCSRLSRRFKAAKLYHDNSNYISASSEGYFSSVREALKVFPDMLGTVRAIALFFLALRGSRECTDNLSSERGGEAA